MVKPLRVSVLLLHAVSVAAANIDDPTRPSYLPRPAPTKEAPGWTLSSVIRAPNYGAAIINGKTVRIGEDIDRAKLVSIEQDRVILRARGGRKVLRLFPSVEIKTKQGVKE